MCEKSEGDCTKEDCKKGHYKQGRAIKIGVEKDPSEIEWNTGRGWQRGRGRNYNYGYGRGRGAINKPLCREWEKNGRCWYGERCWWAHEDDKGNQKEGEKERENN